VKSGFIFPILPNGATLVLINASPQDLHIADTIGNDLQQWQIDFDILPDNLALDEVLASAESNAIMVVYGDCPQDWVQQRVRVLRQLALGKKTNAPLCAVCVAPPPLDQKEPLRCRFSSLRVIRPRHPWRLSAIPWSLLKLL
jgi:hypothetical protein